MQIKTEIIPASLPLVKVDQPHKLDYKSICVFMALGFFLDQDTYWKDFKCLSSATNYTLKNNKVAQSNRYFEWHYSPRSISFNQALDEFAQLFEQIIKEQVGSNKVILPLSGGLDSRTQAAALRYLNQKVHSYSYSFENGYDESKIAKSISRVCNFKFQSFKIQKGYLWNVIDELAQINGCYSDFTNPRQMAIYDQFKDMGCLLYTSPSPRDA